MATVLEKCLDIGMAVAPLMLRNCFIDFAVELRFGRRATELGYAGDIGAIDV